MQPKRYTHCVALLRRFLWVLIVGVIGVLVWIASDNTGENKARIVFSNIAKSENLKNVMINPSYQGVDAHDRPYTIMADKATQLDADDVFLEKVHADMAMEGGGWFAMNAGSGVLNTKTKLLALHDGVDIFYSGGYEFRVDHANIDIQNGSAYADVGIEGQGPPGTLQAESFSAERRGQAIHFKGSVRVKLFR